MEPHIIGYGAKFNIIKNRLILNIANECSIENRRNGVYIEERDQLDYIYLENADWEIIDAHISHTLTYYELIIRECERLGLTEDDSDDYYSLKTEIIENIIKQVKNYNSYHKLCIDYTKQYDFISLTHRFSIKAIYEYFKHLWSKLNDIKKLAQQFKMM